MKTIRCILIAGLSLAFTTEWLPAEKPFWSARIEVAMVKVSPAAALLLVPRLQNEESAGAAFREILRMIQDEKADVLGWPMVVVESGRRSVSETVEEVRFPKMASETIFGVPQNFASTPPDPLPMDWRRAFDRIPWGPITPVEFETRNAGPILEVEAGVEDNGERIQLNLVAQYVRLTKFQEFVWPPALNGMKGVLFRPEFATSSCTSSLTTRNGRWRLLSSFTEQKPDADVILFLLRATSILAGTQEPAE